MEGSVELLKTLRCIERTISHIEDTLRRAIYYYHNEQELGEQLGYCDEKFFYIDKNMPIIGDPRLNFIIEPDFKKNKIYSIFGASEPLNKVIDKVKEISNTFCHSKEKFLNNSPNKYKFGYEFGKIVYEIGGVTADLIAYVGYLEDNGAKDDEQ